MRFLPKRLASTDHWPGPIIAKLAPLVARSSEIQPTSLLEKAVQSPTAATVAPASGVQNPTRRNAPAAAPSICGIVKKLIALKCAAQLKSEPAVANRSNKSPTPGHPLANVENNRCRGPPPAHTLPPQASLLEKGEQPQKEGLSYTPFGGATTR